MPYLHMPPPLPYPESEGFWQGCKNHELLIRRCLDCKTYRHPPLPVCPNCQSWKWEWSKISGKGRVEGFTIVTRALFPGMPVPYNVARVEMEEQKGLLIIVNIINCPLEDIAVDMTVKVIFEELSDNFTIYYFEPI